MADDSFIREVNEELRSERAKQVWKNFGPLLIGGAVAVVIGTAAWVGYQHWTDSKASASGDKFRQHLISPLPARTMKPLQRSMIWKRPVTVLIRFWHVCVRPLFRLQRVTRLQRLPHLTRSLQIMQCRHRCAMSLACAQPICSLILVLMMMSQSALKRFRQMAINAFRRA